MKTQHELTARAHYWATTTIAAVALVSLFAFVQRQDAADDRQIRQQVAEKARGEAK